MIRIRMHRWWPLAVVVSVGPWSTLAGRTRAEWANGSRWCSGWTHRDWPPPF